MNTILSVRNRIVNIDENPKGVNTQEGQHVVGKVKEKDDKGTLVEVLGKDVVIPSNIKVKESVGEDCFFDVQKSSGNKIQLKYMPSQEYNKQTNNPKKTSLKNLWNKNIPMNKEMMDLITSIQNKDSNIEDKYIDIINNTKKQLESLFSKVTDTDIQKLLQDNLNPEKISIELFEKTVSDNKSAVENEDVEKISREMTKETNKQIEKYTKMFGNEYEIKAIIKKLKEKNLPVNEQNIAKIRGTVNKYEAIKDIEDSAILNVLKKKSQLTVDKLYEAKYTNGQHKSTNNEDNNRWSEQSHAITDEELTKLEPQIKDILKNENIDINDTTVTVAKTFIKNEIDINKESIDNYLYIKDIDNKISNDKIIEDAVNNIAKDNKIDDINLIESNTSSNNEDSIKTKEIIEKLPAIKDEHIKDLIMKGNKINLDNLQKESSKKDIKNQVNQLTQEENTQYITAKRQLEEIRLKMTVESAHRLADNNIKIDTAPLNEIVEGLKAIENEQIRNKLNNIGAVDSKDNVEKMKETLHSIEEAKKTSMYVLGKVMQKTVDFTLKGISAHSITNNINHNAQEMYDKLGTKPRADLGDRVSNTFNQLESILKDLGIEISNETIRASRILAHNELEISISNINNIKLLDQKVNIVLNRLHPNIVANMIKDNLSPVDINIDEVIQYMEKFDELIGDDLSDKLARYIHEMDRDNSLSEKERQGMIGIYRMLNTITKSEGKAVGFLMKKNMKLSLNNLMEASKYLRRTNGKKADINLNIDDSFGATEELRYNSEPIRKQIEIAFKKAGLHPTNNNDSLIEIIEEFELKVDKDNLIDMQYLENNIKELIRDASPNRLKQLVNKKELFNKPIEEVLEEFDKIQDNEEIDIKQLSDRLNQIKSISSDAIKLLQEQKLPINMKNLVTINNLLQDNNELSHKLKDIVTQLNELNIESDISSTIANTIESLASGNDIKNIYDKLQRQLKEIKGKAISLDRKNKVKINNNVTDIHRLLDMNKELKTKQNYIQIPIMLGDEMSQLNMYYINDEKSIDDESLKVLLSLETKNLGVVTGFIKINDDDIDIKLSSSIEKETSYIKQFNTQIRTIIEDMGYNVNTIEYEEQSIKMPLTNSKKEINNKVMKNSDDGSFEILI